MRIVSNSLSYCMIYTIKGFKQNSEIKMQTIKQQYIKMKKLKNINIKSETRTNIKVLKINSSTLLYRLGLRIEDPLNWFKLSRQSLLFEHP